VGLVSIDGDGSWRSKVEVEVDGVGWSFWAIKKAKKSEKNITITTASGFEPRTLNPLVLCGRYPGELPLLRLPLAQRSSHMSCYLHLPYMLTYQSTAADSASKKFGFMAASG
jgi:hypothetical protein